MLQNKGGKMKIKVKLMPLPIITYQRMIDYKNNYYPGLKLYGFVDKIIKEYLEKNDEQKTISETKEIK